MDDAEPLNDAEAMAVLMALGSVLKWVPIAPKSYTRNGSNGSYVAHAPGSKKSRDTVLYRIIPVAKKYLRNGKVRIGVGYTAENEQAFRQPSSHRDFDDLPAAKAACERHHATGKWE